MLSGLVVVREGQRNLTCFLSLCQQDETALTLHTLAHNKLHKIYMSRVCIKLEKCERCYVVLLVIPTVG